METVFKIGLTVLIPIAAILFFWVIPIWFGLKWAKIKNVSRLWMLFGFHPFGGWIAYLVLRYGVDPKKECEQCKEAIKMEAHVCRYCGNQMSREEISQAKIEYENRKK